MNGEISLVKLKKGERGEVIRVEGGRGVISKLENMGIRTGTAITKVSQQFMGGPVTVQAGSVHVAMGFGMANKVFAEIG